MPAGSSEALLRIKTQSCQLCASTGAPLLKPSAPEAEIWSRLAHRPWLMSAPYPAHHAPYTAYLVPTTRAAAISSPLTSRSREANDRGGRPMSARCPWRSPKVSFGARWRDRTTGQSIARWRTSCYPMDGCKTNDQPLGLGMKNALWSTCQSQVSSAMIDLG